MFGTSEFYKGKLTMTLLFSFMKVVVTYQLLELKIKITEIKITSLSRTS